MKKEARKCEHKEKVLIRLSTAANVKIYWCEGCGAIGRGRITQAEPEWELPKRDGLRKSSLEEIYSDLFVDNGVVVKDRWGSPGWTMQAPDGGYVRVERLLEVMREREIKSKIKSKSL